MLCTHRCLNQPPYLSVFYFFCMLHPLADICNPSTHTYTHTHTHTHTHKPYMLVCHNLCYMVLSQSPTTCLCLITCLCIIAFSTYQCFIVSTTCWCHIISATWSLLIASITSLCLIASIPWSCLIHFCVT